MLNPEMWLMVPKEKVRCRRGSRGISACVGVIMDGIPNCTIKVIAPHLLKWQEYSKSARNVLD